MKKFARRGHRPLHPRVEDCRYACSLRHCSVAGHPPCATSCAYDPPVAPLYLSASGDRGIPEELRATRKP
jgi:hypothetical protein